MDKGNSYLRKAHLQGYKSISNVNIDFLPGLNLIIGKNAAGKTNFLTFLNNVLRFSYDSLFYFKSDVEIVIADKEYKVAANKEEDLIAKSKDINSFLLEKINIELLINNELSENKLDIDSAHLNRLIQTDITFISHGVPLKYFFVDIPVNFTIKEAEFSKELAEKLSDDTPYFVKQIVAELLFVGFVLKENKIESLYESLQKACEAIVSKIKSQLQKFSPIEDIRFSENVSIFESDDRITVNNLFLEFNIDGDWHMFSSLSDGTKRLFYLISEISDNSNLKFFGQGFVVGGRDVPRIILIEEPELGIHPHQFHKLMQFLKQQSEDKQIIMSTHSPQSLDILDKDELNRIIIAYYNKIEKTQLRHLNNDEIVKAQKYIEEEFLSDYWRLSDLEK